MAQTMISGVVKPGRGGAGKIPEIKMQARQQATGMALVRGTLNVHTTDLNSALVELAEPHCDSSEDFSPGLGKMRIWHAVLHWNGHRFPCVVVRHDHTGTRYLEVMSDVNFEDKGIRSGSSVEIEVLTMSEISIS